MSINCATSLRLSFEQHVFLMVGVPTITVRKKSIYRPYGTLWKIVLIFLPILNAYGIKEDVIIAPLGVKDW
jgi:hypothetical protein